MRDLIEPDLSSLMRSSSLSVLATFVTSHHVVRGMLETRKERLLDFLNRSQSNFLRLEDAEVLSHLGQAEPGTKLSHAIVRKADICMAIPDEAPARPIEKVLFSYAAKQSYKAFIATLDYSIEGSIHLKRCSDEVAVLTRELGEFLPVTGARLARRGNPAQVSEHPIAIVNANSVSLFSLLPMNLQDGIAS